MGLRETFPVLAPLFPPAKQAPLPERADPEYSLDAFGALLNQLTYQGLTYTYPSATQEDAGGDYANRARTAAKASSVVFACMDARTKLFSEARFQFRQIRKGRPGDLFGDESLKPLETPWEGATTGDLLYRMLQHSDLAGNAYVVRRGSRLIPLRPDWVSILAGVPGESDATVWHPDAEVIAYSYQEGGPGSGKDKVFFMADEVAHFAPIPDPEARFRGMSWLTPVVREIMADKAATEHKLTFFENGGTPKTVVKIDTDDLDQFSRWIDKHRADHEGIKGAYKTMYVGQGHDVTVVGKDMQQMDFKVTQGAGETRIAAAAGVPPIVVGLSEGLEAATYSNYGQARRRFADNTMRPLWRNAAGSLARIIDVPDDAELWYDDRDIKALQDDALDDANIRNTQATAIRTLLDAGFVSDSAVAAVTSGDFSRLKHSGLFSVQLQPPGAGPPQPPRDFVLEELVRAVGTGPQQPVLSIAEGAFRLELPAAPDVTMNVEAAKAPDVHVTVEPTQVRVEPTQVTVEPARVEVPITVEAARVNVEPAAVNLSVEPARVEIPVNVEAARVEVPVNVEAPRIEVPIVVEPARADVVVNVEPASVQIPVTVDTSGQQAIVDAINRTLDDLASGRAEKTVKVIRDDDNRVVGYEERGRSVMVERDADGRTVGYKIERTEETS